VFQKTSIARHRVVRWTLTRPSGLTSTLL
jgi:hypothetical protein